MLKQSELFGLGLRRPHFNFVLNTLPRIGFFEVITENYLRPAPDLRKVLSGVREKYPIALHGVSLSIGSKAPFSREYLELWKNLIQDFQPLYVSDHLCWTGIEGFNSHDLLPIPYTKAALDLVVERIHFVQEFLQRKIILENPSAYLGFGPAEYSEAQFFREMVQKTGCQILLDLNNLYVNQHNLGFSALEMISSLPTESLAYFHLAGHTKNGNLLIDTHDHKVAEAVWPIYQEAVKKWPMAKTLLEWDDNIPEFEELMNELVRIEAHRLNSSRQKPEIISKENVNLADKKLENFQEIFSLELRQRKPLEVLANEGGSVYSHAFRQRILESMKNTFPILFFIMEDAGFKFVVEQYIEQFPPQDFSIDFVGKNFTHYLAHYEFGFDFGVPNKLLSEIAFLEWYELENYFKEENTATLSSEELVKVKAAEWQVLTPILRSDVLGIEFEFDVKTVICKFREGILTDAPPQKINYQIVYFENKNAQFINLNANEFRQFQCWKSQNGEFIDSEAYTSLFEKCFLAKLIVGLHRNF